MKYNVAASQNCDRSGLPCIKDETDNRNWGLNIMKLRKLTVVLASLGLASVALAGEEMKTRMAIALVDGDNHGEMRLEFDSDDLGFDLHDMQEGENHSIVDKSGRTILITREADGVRFEVEGKTIRMPIIDDECGASGWASHGDITDVDVHVMHDTSITSAHGMNGVMIFSGRPIDEATQQAIISMLESAGHGSEIRFVDAEGPHAGSHMVKVIEKVVEVTK